MTAFRSAESYNAFAASVQSEWRYARNAEQSEFLSTLLETSGPKIETIAAGGIVYRAQLGCAWPETAEDEDHDPGPRPFGRDRMKPLRHRALEGRVNPRGIPCLYVATREQTAAAEVRPWIGAYVSVARLRVLRDLRVVNLTSDDQRLIVYFVEPEPPERERAVWRDIDRAFSRPVERDEGTADYAPTQIIAEMFREQGLDGVGYRSSLGDGHNLALFDLDCANVLDCTVLHVDALRFSFDEAANRRFYRDQTIPAEA